MDIKAMLQMAYCCWLVECNKPLTIGSASVFQDMIKLLDHCRVISERRDVLNCLDLLRIDVSNREQLFLALPQIIGHPFAMIIVVQ